jgi:ribosome-interacting GTPase 1
MLFAVGERAGFRIRPTPANLASMIVCMCTWFGAVCDNTDAITIEELDLVSKIPHHVPISANHMWNLDELLERIWEYLGMIRIYTKPK